MFFVLVAISVLFTQTRLLKSGLEVRKFLASTIWFLIMGTLIAFSFSKSINHGLMITSVPLCISLAYFFKNIDKKYAAEGLSLGILAVIICVQYVI